MCAQRVLELPPVQLGPEFSTLFHLNSHVAASGCRGRLPPPTHTKPWQPVLCSAALSSGPSPPCSAGCRELNGKGCGF